MQSSSGLVAFDRDRTYCTGCASFVWVEFTTRDGRLVQLPLECGHTYDADAEPPPLEVNNFKDVERPCEGCGVTVYGANTHWCTDCRKINHRRLNREYEARKRAQREVGA